MQEKKSGPQVTDSALRLPQDIPEIPPEVIERFPQMAGWMDNFKRFWNQNTNAVNDFARAVLDVTEIGGLFVVDGANQSIYVKGTRDRGAYKDPDTPVYFDKAGYFSLKQKLYWDPTTNILTIDGTIFAEAGNIGGFDLGPDFIRDEGDSFGLASTVTGGNDVRFWAGSTFAARDTAPFRVYEDGSIFASMGTIGGFVLGTDYIRDSLNSFGLASTVTGADDIRFWAGETFANRATAPFRVTEAGVVTAISGTIGGWTLSATTLSGTNAVLAAAGTLLLGTGNDVAILDANDATYRLWIGNATAGIATFSVTKTGALFSTAGVIGGFTIGTDFISAGTGNNSIVLTGGGSGGTVRAGSITTPAGSTNSQLDYQGVKLGYLSAPNTTTLTVELVTLTDSGFLSLGGPGWGIEIGAPSGEIVFLSDTNLYRSGANTLRTDGAFLSASLSTGAISGTTGNFSGQVSADSFNTTSSARFKTNIHPLYDALSIVRKLQGVVFDWKTRDVKGDIGFIAEEVAEVLPTMVGLDQDSRVSGVDYGRITSVLVQAVKELEERINGLGLHGRRG